MRVDFYFALLACIVMSSAGEDNTSFLTDEKRLYKDLLSRNNPHVRPVRNSTETQPVRFGMALLDIIDVNEKENMITLHVWLRKMWQDVDLTWEPADYNGITTTRLPADSVWKPDIVLFNTAPDGQNVYRDSMVVVYNTGDVLWIPPAVIKSRCFMDMTDFPFDTQTCQFKFASWVYDGNAIDPQFYEGKEEIDLSDYGTNNEWNIIDTTAKRNVIFYPCCSEHYPDLVFNLTISRKNSVFSVILVTPYIFLAILCPVIFLLPYNESQRFSLGGSIMICLVLLLSVFEEILPVSTAGGTPMIAQYYISILVLLSLSMVFSAIILNLAGRKLGPSRPPKFLKVILVDGLGRILCVPKDNEDSLIDKEMTRQNSDTSQAHPGCNEWKLMAQALDRLFLLIYVLLTAILTIAFLIRRNLALH